MQNECNIDAEKSQWTKQENTTFKLYDNNQHLYGSTGKLPVRASLPIARYPSKRSCPFPPTPKSRPPLSGKK